MNGPSVRTRTLTKGEKKVREEGRVRAAVKDAVQHYRK